MAPAAARRLARFVVRLRPDDVPPPVIARATLLALDTLGGCLAAARYDFGRAALETAERLGGPPESALIGGKTRVAAANAVLANATLAHGLDFDDTREDAIVHTGSVAVTTALAVGEALGASGRAALTALVAGVEVMCRVGLAVPGRFHARHYHPTSLTGGFAAAAVAGKLHGLGEDALVHETFAITTLYVTHDQAEAMVISDRVAVLHRGRVAQVGTAEDLFQSPRTRFVAEFIGKTNLVDATAAAPGVVIRGALRLRVAAGGLAPGAPVAISIRPHEIALLAPGAPAPDGRNVLAGTVRRVSYLGDAVDYQVAVGDSDVVLRVTAPPPARFAAGARVLLAVAPEACVPLAGDGKAD